MLRTTTTRRASVTRRSPPPVAVLGGVGACIGPPSCGDWPKRVNLHDLGAEVPERGKPGVGGDESRGVQTGSVVMNERTLDRASLRLPAALLLAGQVLYIVITQF